MKVKHTAILNGKHNNCVPLAFKNACSWLDEQHILDVGLSNKFYSEKGGTTTGLVPKYMDHLGIQYKKIYDCWDDVSVKKPTIHRFAAKHPKGVYLLIVRGHGMILNNGKVFDPNMGNYGIQRRILEAFEILNSDMKAQTDVWDQKTKFILAAPRLKLAGLGFRKGSFNHTIIRKMAGDPAFVDHPFSYTFAKEKVGMTMTTWIYFIERGIIHKEK